MENWKIFKSKYLKDNLDKKKLVTPKSKVDALNVIDTLMLKHFPEFVKQPKFLKQIPMEQFLKELKWKKDSELNRAETAVIAELYKLLPEL